MMKIFGRHIKVVACGLSVFVALGLWYYFSKDFDVGFNCVTICKNHVEWCGLSFSKNETCNRLFLILTRFHSGDRLNCRVDDDVSMGEFYEVTGLFADVRRFRLWLHGGRRIEIMGGYKGAMMAQDYKVSDNVTIYYLSTNSVSVAMAGADAWQHIPYVGRDGGVDEGIVVKRAGNGAACQVSIACSEHLPFRYLNSFFNACAEAGHERALYCSFYEHPGSLPDKGVLSTLRGGGSGSK